jgi:hypothetical protein
VEGRDVTRWRNNAVQSVISHQSSVITVGVILCVAPTPNIITRDGWVRGACRGGRQNRQTPTTHTHTHTKCPDTLYGTPCDIPQHVL